MLLSYPTYCITPLNKKTLYSLQKKFFVLKSYNCPIWICVAGLIGKAHLIRLSHTIVPLRLTNQRRRWSWKVRAEVPFFRPHGRIHKLSSGPNCSNTDFARVHFTWTCPWCLSCKLSQLFEHRFCSSSLYMTMSMMSILANIFCQLVLFLYQMLSLGRQSWWIALKIETARKWHIIKIL